MLAELDYLITRNVGHGAFLRLMGEITRGAYHLVEFDNESISRCLSLMERFADVGLADASVCVIAHRFGTNDILTLDQRHFRLLTGVNAPAFRLLPADT